MAIPNSPEFEDFLSSTRVVLNRPTGPSVAFSTTHGREPLYLEYPAARLSLQAVLRAICRELRLHGSVTDPDVAVAVLGILSETRPPATPAVAHANYCLSRVHTAQVHQHLVLPIPCPPGYEIEVGDVRLRAFDPSRLLYWADRGRSQFPVDLLGFSGHTALERKCIGVCLLNWDSLADCGSRAVATRGSDFFLGLLDAYYAAAFRHLMKEIPDRVRGALLVLEAGALVHLDVTPMFAFPGARYVGLFHWQHEEKQRTWAVLSWVASVTLGLIPSSVVSASRRWVRDDLGFRGLDPARALDRTIEAVCRVLQRAHDHRLRHRGDEAALHFVIALDLLFGDQGRSTETIADRTALLVHQPLGATLEEAVRRVKRLYDARSKYVHEGCPIPPDVAAEAERMATEVLWCLLAVSGAGAPSNTAEWLRKVDYTLAALRDGRSVSDADLRAVGVSVAARRAPAHVHEDPDDLLDWGSR